MEIMVILMNLLRNCSSCDEIYEVKKPRKAIAITMAESSNISAICMLQLCCLTITAPVFCRALQTCYQKFSSIQPCVSVFQKDLSNSLENIMTARVFGSPSHIVNCLQQKGCNSFYQEF